jgi:hypothetical protein
MSTETAAVEQVLRILEVFLVPGAPDQQAQSYWILLERPEAEH